MSTGEVFSCPVDGWLDNDNPKEPSSRTVSCAKKKKKNPTFWDGFVTGVGCAITVGACCNAPWVGWTGWAGC